MNMGPRQVHETVLKEVLKVQRLIEKERAVLKRALAEAQVKLDEDSWKEHSRVAIFLALKEAQMRDFGECLILEDDEEDDL